MRITRAKKPSADLGAQPFHLGGSHAALSLTSLVICKCESRKVRSWYPERSFSGQREPVPASQGSPPLRLLHSLAVSSKVFGDNSTAQVKREPQRAIPPLLHSNSACCLGSLGQTLISFKFKIKTSPRLLPVLCLFPHLQGVFFLRYSQLRLPLLTCYPLIIHFFFLSKPRQSTANQRG